MLLKWIFSGALLSFVVGAALYFFSDNEKSKQILDKEKTLQIAKTIRKDLSMSLASLARMANSIKKRLGSHMSSCELKQLIRGTCNR